MCMASLHPVEVVQKGVKHGISAQNHFQKRRKKIFGSLIALGFLPIFLWQRRRIRSQAEVKQNLKHYPSWAESIGKLGLKTLCGCPQKAKCHVQVTVRICSAVKTLEKSGGFFCPESSSQSISRCHFKYIDPVLTCVVYRDWSRH